MAKVITFFGGEPKVGTTMTAQCFAEELAKKNANVLMLFASSNIFDDFIKNEEGSMSIDDLLDIEEITKKDIEKVMRKTSDFWYIKGITHPFWAKYFPVDILQKMCDLLDADFDYIIIDGGSNYQMPLPVSALLASNKRYYVISAKERCVERCKSFINLIVKNPAIGMHNEDEIILNRYYKNAGSYKPENIKELFNLPVNTIPKVQTAAICEVTKETIKDKSFRSAIRTLVETVQKG